MWMVHTNSIRIIMEKENDQRILFLFRDGKARGMTDGFGELVTFNEIYNKLIKDGYKQVH